MHNFSCNTLEFPLLKMFCAFSRVAIRRFLGKDHEICLPAICLVALVSQISPPALSEEGGPKRALINVQKIISIRKKPQLWNGMCTLNPAHCGFKTLDLVFGIQMPWMLLGRTGGSSSTSGIAIPESLLWQSSWAPAHRGGFTASPSAAHQLGCPLPEGPPVSTKCQEWWRNGSSNRHLSWI